MATALSNESERATAAGRPTRDESEVEVTYIWAFSENDGVLNETFRAYLRAACQQKWSFEFIVVSNGVSEEVVEELRREIEESDAAVKMLFLHKAFTESSVLSTACAEARGKWVVALPSYLQIDPRAIGPLVAELEAGSLDYVASWRQPRVDPPAYARKSRVFNWLTRRITRVVLHDINSGLRAMKKQVLDDVAIYGDLHRFLPVLAHMQGFRVGEIQTRHLDERISKQDYRLGVYLRRLLDLLTLFFITKFTKKPLRFFGLLGSAFIFVGSTLSAVLVVQRILGQALENRPLFLVSILLVVFGIQLFSLGLLGELIIFFHARSLREYRIEKIVEHEPGGVPCQDEPTVTR